MLPSFFDVFTRLKILVAIIIVLLIVVSISSYLFFRHNATVIDNTAMENIRQNTESQTKELDISLVNKMEVVSSNLQIISLAPSLKENRITSLPLFEAAQNSSKDFSDYYAQTNSSGNIIWASDFKDKDTYDKIFGQSIAFEDYFKMVMSTAKPYITPLVDSILNVPSIFVSYPIFITSNIINNNTLAIKGKEYITNNIFEIAKNQEEQDERSTK